MLRRTFFIEPGAEPVRLLAGDPDCAVPADEAEQRLAGRGFSAAGFADERERLARRDLERDVLHGMDARHASAKHAAPDVVADGQVANIDDGRRGSLAIDVADVVARSGFARPAIAPSRGTAASSIFV